ncbi:MAG TPA: hypothetical protein PLI77_08550 [Bacteroidales bacterium]|nr:hypothetical protein [Bacteroidales bacterium]HRW35503.1 hypothetical protein [Thermotogota bacterium]
MEADERILNKLEQLQQVFSDLKQHVSDIQMKMNTGLGSIDEKREEFEQLNGRVAGLVEQISIYADTLKDILGYKTQLEDMIVKVHKIDFYKQRHDELESNFQSLSEKINMSIEEIESRLLDFEVSCEEDLVALNDRLSNTGETKAKLAEQIRYCEEKSNNIEEGLKNSAEKTSELERRQHNLEDFQISKKVEKIDAFMTQKTDIQNSLLQNAQEIDRQNSELLIVQESMQRSEEKWQEIRERSDELDAFVEAAKKEFDNIRETTEKAIEEFSHYIDSQPDQIKRIRNDFNQNLKSFEEDHQKQIKSMGDDEMDRIKTEIKFCENDAVEQLNQRSAEIQDYLKEGKQTLLKQRDTAISEMELFSEQVKSDLEKKLSEIETAHQEQLKVKDLIEDDKNGLDKSLKVNKWMLIINMMVMGMTVTVLLLSVLF